MTKKHYIECELTGKINGEYLEVKIQQDYNCSATLYINKERIIESIPKPSYELLTSENWKEYWNKEVWMWQEDVNQAGLRKLIGFDDGLFIGRYCDFKMKFASPKKPF